MVIHIIFGVKYIFILYKLTVLPKEHDNKCIFGRPGVSWGVLVCLGVSWGIKTDRFINVPHRMRNCMMSLGLYTEIRMATKLGCLPCTKCHGGESATGKK